MLVFPSPDLWPHLLPDPQKPPVHRADPPAPRPLCPPVSSLRLPPATILSEIPPTILEIPGPGKSRGSFQEILFLESPLTFGLGLAPRRHCFVLDCFYCYSLKNLEPGCPGALAPLGLGRFPCGQGIGLEVLLVGKDARPGRRRPDQPSRDRGSRQGYARRKP